MPVSVDRGVFSGTRKRGTARNKATIGSRFVARAINGDSTLVSNDAVKIIVGPASWVASFHQVAKGWTKFSPGQ